MSLSAERQNQIFIPGGFAHGLVALSDTVQVLSKCSDSYDPASECGNIWNVPDLAISWGISILLVSAPKEEPPALKDTRLSAWWHIEPFTPFRYRGALILKDSILLGVATPTVRRL